MKKIQTYKRESLEASLKKVMNSKHKMIGGKYSPIVFNMDYIELSFKSDGLNLYGWYINNNAQKTIIINHGRKNNRIFSVKFLQLFKDMSLKEEYNIFLPDLRNSGKSDVSKTAFGYYFSKDILNAMIMLKNNYGTKDYILYGFSQGAMGSALVNYLYKDKLREYDINVKKIILDSPVANVKETILEHSNLFGYKIPYFIMSYPLAIFNLRVDNKLNELRLSKILGDVETLILQSENDVATSFKLFIEEYNLLKERSVEENFIKPIIKIFRSGGHVRIYLRYKWEYTKEIENFLNL